MHSTLAVRMACMAPASTDKLDNGRNIMWLIVLEAAGALAVLGFVVWWTMFSGRKQGELPPEVIEPDQVERGGNKKLKG